MESHKDFINAWGAILLSEDLTENGCKVKYKTVASWRDRDSIPVRYFEDIEEVSKKKRRQRGIKITVRDLVRMAKA